VLHDAKTDRDETRSWVAICSPPSLVVHVVRPVRLRRMDSFVSRRESAHVRLQAQRNEDNRARQLYVISMLFLFPVKDGKLSTGVNATFDASCYG